MNRIQLQSIFKLAICFFLPVWLIFSCQKASQVSAPASLNVVDVYSASQMLLPVFGTNDTITFYSNIQPLSFGNSTVLSLIPGTIPYYAVIQGDTTQQSLKSKLTSGQFTASPGALYSLYFTGDSAQFDTFLSKDTLPIINDSSGGLRFLNLIQGPEIVSISLSDSTIEYQRNNIAYKQQTTWSTFPINAINNGNFQFVITDASSGDTLLAVSWYALVGKSNTIVLAGSYSSNTSNSIQSVLVNNF